MTRDEKEDNGRLRVERQPEQSKLAILGSQVIILSESGLLSEPTARQDPDLRFLDVKNGLFNKNGSTVLQVTIDEIMTMTVLFVDSCEVAMEIRHHRHA